MKPEGELRPWLRIALLALLTLSCVAEEENSTSVIATSTIMATKDGNGSLIVTTPNVTQSTPVTTSVPVSNSSSKDTSTLPPTVVTTGMTTGKISSPAATTKEPVKMTTIIDNKSVATSSMASSVLTKTSGFDMGSFIGGIVLTVGLLAVAYFGCRFYNSKRGVRYRTIDEHEAII
ncbi:porimin [Spea bombifrons]|uniref:porimin n=1 Tax=Spea bombifrons TaxID=233779 RepID=UPI0023496B34|nr:porimin [Spea bombifrons]